MGFTIIIPARYASSRLPGKPLLDIAGKPMISHVIDQAKQSDPDEVIVATDDQRIADVARANDVTAYITDTSHNSGTERIAEVINLHKIADDTIIVNLQGDEPIMPRSCLNLVGNALASDRDVVMATLSTPIRSIDEFNSLSVVKLVCDKDGNALYFSRAPIPCIHDGPNLQEKIFSESMQFHRHIGLYAYRASFVLEYVSWGSSPIEKIESLEQLRVLCNGRKIKVVQTDEIPPPGVNTQEELEYVEKLIRDGVVS